MKKILILLSVIVIILSALYFLSNKDKNKVEIKKDTKTIIDNKEEIREVVQGENENMNGKEVGSKTENKNEFIEKDINQEQEIVSLEVSRVRKDCGDKKCLQVKEENGEWKILKTDILDFQYKDGYYYVLEVEKKEVGNDIEYKLIGIKKEIKPKKTV